MTLYPTRKFLWNIPQKEPTTNLFPKKNVNVHRNICSGHSKKKQRSRESGKKKKQHTARSEKKMQSVIVKDATK
jgi:hypothetical protein